MAQVTRYFCTYFDKNYLSRGLNLYHSIAQHHPAFRLFVCCMDDEAHAYLARRALPGLEPVRLADLEAADPELLACKPTRSRVEYYFTTTAAWLRFLFDRHADVDLLTYVDADIAFFSSSEPALREMADASIAIVEHRYPARLAALATHGRFNVGWLAFRRDEQGRAAIERWRAQCIEWCYDRVEPTRFADQKYLDEWPARFDRLRVMRHRGVNVAPWNLDGEPVSPEGSGVAIAGDPLVCFHFHGLKHVSGPLYESGLRAYGVRLDPLLRDRVFRPYLAQLLVHERELRIAGVTAGHAKSLRGIDTPLAQLRARAMKVVTIARLLASRSYLLAPIGLSAMKRTSAGAA
jgi:hypothetical protein